MKILPKEYLIESLRQGKKTYRKEALAKSNLLPSTMGAYGENFSTMPTDILLGLADVAKLEKLEINSIDDSIRAAKVPKTITVGGVKKRIVTTPFTKFKGIMTEEGRGQLLTGDGIDTSAGELRKALTNRMYLKNVQQRLGFNEEDLIASITDPAPSWGPKGVCGQHNYQSVRRWNATAIYSPRLPTPTSAGHTLDRFSKMYQ